MTGRPANIDLGKTQITPDIRVSSAALYRADLPGPYWLVETWVFSNDTAQRNVQVIHGTCSALDGKPPRRYLCDEARRVHGHISDNLLKRFRGGESDAEQSGNQLPC